MQVVHYSQIALQLLEKQHNNVRLGAAHAFQMEFHAYRNPNAPLIKLNKAVKIKELMELVFGYLINQILELVDFNYAQMPLQISIPIKDALHIQLIHSVQPQALAVFHCQLVHSIKFRLDVL